MDDHDEPDLQAAVVRTSPRRALVLGGGFIGSSVARELQSLDWSVEVLGRQSLDLTRADGGALLAARLDSEVILVFTSAVTPDRDDSESAHQANLRMVDGVVAGMADVAPAACVFFSSTSVYGEVGGDRVLSEATPLRPVGDYARGKADAEGRLTDVAARHGIPLLIVRPSVVYGPGDTHTQYGPSALVRGWRAGEVFVYGGGEDARDFVYIDDVTRAAGELLVQGATGVFNVTGASSTFRNILSLLELLDPRPVACANRPRKIPPSRISFDATRLQARVPGHPTVSLEEGLRRTLCSHGAPDLPCP